MAVGEKTKNVQPAVVSYQEDGKATTEPAFVLDLGSHLHHRRGLCPLHRPLAHPHDLVYEPRLAVSTPWLRSREP
jgi:hypothetical protein